jgi:hypothetical protein
MSAGYKVRGVFQQPSFSPTADELYWLLDSLGLDEPQWIVIESHDDDWRGIQATWVGERLITVEFREGADAEMSEFPAVDVLTAHQLILGCMSNPQDWVSVARGIVPELETSAFARSAEESIRERLSYDYSKSGLSVQVAVLDYVKSAEHLGVAATPPLMINWGALRVTPGDVWAVSGPGRVSVVVERFAPEQRHGISISSARPGLGFDGMTNLPEVVLWPDGGRTEFVVDHDGSVDALRISNVFLYGDGGSAHVARGAENSALSVKVASADERVYHCNYYSTSPPTFDDLVFRVIRTG